MICHLPYNYSYHINVSLSYGGELLDFHTYLQTPELYRRLGINTEKRWAVVSVLVKISNRGIILINSCRCESNYKYIITNLHDIYIKIYV